MKNLICYKGFVFLVSLSLYLPGLTYAQSDLIEVAPPNAMIIFDSSSSMNQDEKGNVVNSGNAKGEDGVVRDYQAGGNHPNSKLYQAKQKIKEVIKDLEDINLGFSTYGQAKKDLRRGYYVRSLQNWTPAIPPTSDQWRWTKKYWRFRNYSHTFTSTSNTLDKSIGDIYIEKNHTFDDSPFNNGKSVPPPHGGTYKADLTHRITNISLNAETNVYTYTYTSDPHDHYEETTRTLTFGNSNSIDCNTLFTKPWGGPPVWNTYDEANAPSHAWRCIGPTKIPGSAGAPGFFGSKYDEYSWNTLDNTIPGYPTCPANYGLDNNWNPVGDPPTQANAWTKWTLVNSSDPKIPASGQYLKITGINCYDASTYSYPADGSASKPHTWSYYKEVSGNWSVKPDPYFPSRDGAGNLNNNPGMLDNHHFFINIPQIDDANNDYANRKAIVDLLDLAPIQSPETGKFHSKLPLKTLDPDPKKRNSITSSEDSPVKQTPLYATLKNAQDYLDSYIKQDALSQVNCRGNAVILITDGLESCEFIDPLHPNFGAASTVADQMKANLNVKTFVIGFGKDAGTNKSSLDDIAKKGGTDQAYFAATKEELQKALQQIFEIIKADKVARSTPVVTRSRDRLYRGYFNFKGRMGHLVAYEISADGTVKGEVSWEGGASSGNGGDAGWVMKNKGRGKVYTWIQNSINPSLLEFDDKNAKTLDSYLNPLAEDIDGNGKVDWKDAKTIIKFILDANYDDSTDGGTHGAGHHKGKRSTDWFLGDIYHSSPLIVADPPLNFPDIPAFTTKYSDFKTTFRDAVIYIGANDGMLHAFNDIDGKEKFAIIPKNLLGKLKELRITHQFYVDSSPRASDVFFGGTWKTVVVSGERGGGNYYFAVDVTDPNNPKILWEWTDPDGRLGFTWSRPEIGWVKISGQEKFVAFVGGGYSATDNVGNTFYVVDIETGTKLRSFDVGDKFNKIPSGATAFDSDLDGRINGVYFGDINGVLWKIKIDKEEDINNWQLIKLYEPGTKSPVFYPPAVTKNNQGRIMVYYGQGNELNLFEQVSSNSFFEIWDKGTSGQMIWEEKLEKGEKVLAAPAVASNVIYFTTWRYTGTSDDCGAGKGRLYGLTMTSLGSTGDIGALLLDPLTGEKMGSAKKYIEITDYFPESKGIPSGPMVTNGMIYISTSLNAGQVITLRIPGWGTGRLKYWREVF